MGGRVWTDDVGTKTFHIRRSVGGIRWEFSLGAIGEKAALAELALFNRDPAVYKSPKERASESLLARSGTGVGLDGATLKAFLDHAWDLVKKDELSEGYVKHTLAPYLAAWAKELGGREFRKLSLDVLQAVLEKWDTAQHKRIVALKAFTTWARETKPAPKLRRQDDPTLDLKVPGVIPGKKRERKDYPIALIEKLYAELPSQAVRDMIRLRCGANGLHDTEIDRIARGEGEIVRVADPNGIEGVLIFRHKKKKADHAISVDAATFAAAERLRERGGKVSSSAMLRAIHRVTIKWHGCGGVPVQMGTRDNGTRKNGSNRNGEPVIQNMPCPKCPRIVPSQLRHSFATWARKFGKEVWPTNQKGVALAAVSEAMGHTKKETTAGFYVGDVVPAMIQIPIKLEHPEDPK